MSERTPNRANGSSTKKRKASPLKKSVSKLPQQIDPASMNAGMVEIDHLQTTIITLNQRVEIIEDMEREVDETRRALDNSDAARAGLQSDLKSNAQKMKQDTSDHANYQEQLIGENEDLRA